MLDCNDKTFFSIVFLMGHTQQHLWLLTVPTPAAWLILSLKLRFFVRCFIVCFFLYTAAADKIAHLDLPICWIHVTCGCHFLRLQGCFLLNQPQFNLWTCLMKVEQILGGSLFSLTHTLSQDMRKEGFSSGVSQICHIFPLTKCDSGSFCRNLLPP